MERMLPLVAMSASVFFAAGLAAAPAPPEGPNALAELPHWPIGLELPDDLTGGRSSTGRSSADVLVWLPPDSRHIRAMFLIPNNSDSKIFGEHAALREVAAKREMAIVYLRSFVSGIEYQGHVPLETPPKDPDRIFKVLALVADATGIPEFRHAPWVTFGKSSRGEFPFHMGWLFPERTIASVSYHGETPTWPIPAWARLKGETVLEVNANGEIEWGGTWFNHVRPSLLNYRARTAWLPHLVVARGVGHGDYADSHGSGGWGKPVAPGMTSCLRVWDYLALFIGKAIDLRVPKGKYPADGPVELKEVDEVAGYLIDPFAVEDLFGVPHLPLKEGPGGYVAGGAEEPPVSGYAAFAPPKDYAAPEGVPLVRPDTAIQGFNDWILTASLPAPMKADPMLELGELQRLTPKPGDPVTIDGQTLTFARITPKLVAKEGGIALGTGLMPRSGKACFLAFTVLEVPEHKCYRLIAPFTAATRQQVVLAGVPVRNRQVLDLQPGRYPLLVVVRMAVKWGRIGPWLEDVTEAEVAQAREMQVEADKRAAAESGLKAAGPQPPPVVIRKAADVPAPERKKMFWVADREQAEAWLNLHNVRGLKVEIGGAE
jgi:hypothetical protein